MAGLNDCSGRKWSLINIRCVSQFVCITFAAQFQASLGDLEACTDACFYPFWGDLSLRVLFFPATPSRYGQVQPRACSEFSRGGEAIQKSIASICQTDTSVIGSILWFYPLISVLVPTWHNSGWLDSVFLGSSLGYSTWYQVPILWWELRDWCQQTPCHWLTREWCLQYA